MLIFVRGNTGSSGHQRLMGQIGATLRYRLSRFSKRLASVDVRVSEIVRKRDVREKRCTIEARTKSCGSVAIAEDAPIFEQALAGAAAKTVLALEQALAPQVPRHVPRETSRRKRPSGAAATQNLVEDEELEAETIDLQA